MAQVTIYLPPKLEKQVRAGARRARRSLSAYIASKLDEGREEVDELGWPKGYLATLRSWANDPLDLVEPDDPPPDFSRLKKAVR